MESINVGINVHSYKEGNYITEAKLRSCIESYIMPKLARGIVVSKSIADLQSFFGITYPIAMCALASEYGMNVKIEYNDAGSNCSFWYDEYN